MKEKIDYKNLAETLYIKRMITEVYPTGIVSLVSDTFDLFAVLTKSLPLLKQDIMARNGGPNSLDKVVIRPDSGDPADILCGDLKAPAGSPQFKGVVELLHDIFGGTVNAQGYKVLDSHIGAIYGDAITIERCDEICQRLKSKGFASVNVVYGIGSYTYQFNTRDTLGFAMKSTSVTINGIETPIFKDPITDDGTKKSALGRVRVKNYGYDSEQGDLLVVEDSNSPSHNSPNLLTPLFENGKLLKETTLAEIRSRMIV